jgi:hypothetical protein
MRKWRLTRSFRMPKARNRKHLPGHRNQLLLKKRKTILRPRRSKPRPKLLLARSQSRSLLRPSRSPAFRPRHTLFPSRPRPRLPDSTTRSPSSSKRRLSRRLVCPSSPRRRIHSFSLISRSRMSPKSSPLRQRQHCQLPSPHSYPPKRRH